MPSATVVIIGGSFAGLNVAHSLLKNVPNIKIVLVNPSSKFYFPIAAPRILAKPNSFRSEQYLIPIKELFAKYPSTSFELIVATATAINEKARSVSTVTSGSGDTRSVLYDYLVIASGSTTHSTTGTDTGLSIPFKQSGSDDMEQLIEAAQHRIVRANSIVIGGAGPIGVELAGELAEAAASESFAGEMSITLVSATERVLPTLKPAASQAARRLLEEKNIKLLVSRKVMKVEQSTSGSKRPWVISLDNGDKISADLYIPTTGVIPNNSFIPAQFLDENGWIKVDRELRIESPGHSRLPIYAAGDITNNSMRLSFKATEQAKVVAANIKVDILRNGSRKTYDQGESVMMIVPVGTSGGTGQVFGLRLRGGMVKMKGKDFFISNALSLVAGSK